MFDFIKDLYFEVNGYDMEKINEQKLQKMEQEKKETIILRKGTKKIILITFLLNLFICVTGLLIAISISDIGGLIKNIILLFTTVITIFALIFKGKSAEVIAIIFMLLTIVLTFVMPVF